MNLFEALEWLSKNPGKELDCIITDRSGPQQLKARNYDGLMQQNFGDGWHACILNLNHAACCSFSIPERKLPELPEGCEWRQDSQGELYIPYNHVYYYSASDETVYKVHKALVEEYETRPK